MHFQLNMAIDCICVCYIQGLPSIFQSRRRWACSEWNARCLNHQRKKNRDRRQDRCITAIVYHAVQDTGCVRSITVLTKYYHCVSLQKSGLDPVPAGWTQRLVPGSSPRTQNWPAQGIPQISVLSVYGHQGVRAQLAEPRPRFTQGLRGSDALRYVQWLRGTQGTLNEMNTKRTREGPPSNAPVPFQSIGCFSLYLWGACWVCI